MGRSYRVWVLLAGLASQAWAGPELKGAAPPASWPLLADLASRYRALHPGLKCRVEAKDQASVLDQFLGRGCDFALTDSPLTEGEERKAMGRSILHLPLAIEAVAITYNLPGVPGGLRLTPAVLSKIFRGEIKRWNDIALTELNQGLDLPAMAIQVLHRDDESSRRDLFPSFLARLDQDWTVHHEKEKDLKWPLGRGIRGNEKIMERLRRWPGVIAAVDFHYAAEHHLPMCELRNEAGRFVAPSLSSLAAATSDWVNLSEDFKVVLMRSRALEAYPLCAFCWLLVYQDAFKASHHHDRAKATADLVQWVFSGGSKGMEDLFFEPLPLPFQAQVREKAGTLQH